MDRVVSTVEIEAPADEKQAPEASPGKVDSPDKVEIIPVQNMFEIHNPTSQERHQLEAIWAYIKESAPSEMTGERLFQLRQLESRMAAPRLGETRLGKLFNLIKMEQQIRQSEKVRDGMLR